MCDASTNTVDDVIKSLPVQNALMSVSSATALDCLVKQGVSSPNMSCTKALNVIIPDTSNSGVLPKKQESWNKKINQLVEDLTLME